MKINSIKGIQLASFAQNKPIQKTQIQTMDRGFVPMSYPKNYYLSFEGRVDKGLERFCKQNEEYMPQTVKQYVQNLSNEEIKNMTPRQAQANAFEYLQIAESIEDVKSVYPNEPLFENLKSSHDTKACRGLLKDVRVMQELLDESGETVVAGDKDLTLYLLKKVFLEAKTVGEINEDLDNDLNPVFKKEDKNYITHSTLSSLGIKLPDTEYLTSLRYTRDGYSDKVGQSITQAWEKLTDEEKQERIELLLSRRGEISPEKREKLVAKQSELMKKRWEEMSPAEKVAYVEKMQTGSMTQKIIMINAWNNCPQIRETLSEHLRSYNYHNPTNVIYKETPMSGFMQEAMSEFWAKHPEYADKLGEEITLSNEAYQKAVAEGKEEEFTAQVLKTQKGIKEIAKSNKKEREQIKRAAQQEEKENLKVQQNFNEAIKKNFYFAPKEFTDSIIDGSERLGKDEKKVLVETMKNPELMRGTNSAARVSLQKLLSSNTNAEKLFGALSQAMSETLINASDKHGTKSLIAVQFNFFELSEIMRKLNKGEKNINYVSNNKEYTLEFNKKPDLSKLNKAYRQYSSEPKLSELENIADFLLQVHQILKSIN